MATKKELLYTGTGPGQAIEIARAGWVFRRGCTTEVPAAVYDLLKNCPGFEPVAEPPKKKKEKSDA